MKIFDIFRARHETEADETPEEIALERMDDGTIREIRDDTGGEDNEDVKEGQ